MSKLNCTWPVRNYYLRCEPTSGIRFISATCSVQFRFGIRTVRYYKYRYTAQHYYRTHTLFISSAGTPVISEDPVFTLTSEDPVEFTLTCTSTGGPATTVTWTPMGNDVTQLQNAASATYTHTLTVTGRVPGEYTCSVSNDRGTATRSITVQGMWIDTMSASLLGH